MRHLKSCLLLTAVLAGSGLLNSCGLNLSGACRANQASITSWQQTQSKPSIYRLQGQYWIALQQSLYKPESPAVYNMTGPTKPVKWFGDQNIWNLTEQREVFVSLPAGSQPENAAQQLPSLLAQRPKIIPRAAFMALGPELVKGRPPKAADSSKLPKQLRLVQTPDYEDELQDKFPQLSRNSDGQLVYYHRKRPGALTNLRAGVYFVTLDMPYQVIVHGVTTAMAIPVVLVIAPISYIGWLIDERQIANKQAPQDSNTAQAAPSQAKNRRAAEQTTKKN